VFVVTHHLSLCGPTRTLTHFYEA